jgi:hypothetical protein
MFTVGPLLGSLTLLQSPIIDGLERIYQNLKSKEEQSWDGARKEANDFIAQAAAAAAQRAKGQQESAVEGEVSSGDKFST